jgi:hypothetical protein
VPHFEFTVFVDGVDLLSDHAQGVLEQLGVKTEGTEIETAEGEIVGADADLVLRTLRYRGGDFFENVMFGRDGDVQYAVCCLDTATEEEAVQWAAAMLTYALPGLRVVAVTPGRHGKVDIR